MFGNYNIPVKIETGVNISLEQEGENFIYHREVGEVKEKVLLGRCNRLILNPVEPVNTPKHITRFLCIDFKKPVVVQPDTERNVLLKFPIEIGVFVAGKSLEFIDVFSLVKQKFTLYGDVDTGRICKQWKSDVYTSLPESDISREGIVELSIENSEKKWAEVNRVVLNADSMKIYYSNSAVSMKARMNVLSTTTAETGIIDSPLQRGMKKSTEVYRAKKLPVTMEKFLMGEGI